MKIEFAYTGLQVRNLDKSIQFYTNVLGMKQKLKKKVKETNGEFCILKSGKNVLELNQYYGKPNKKGTNLDHLGFEVDNLDTILKRLRSKRIKAHEYIEVKNWKRFFISDPDGNWIEVYSFKKTKRKNYSNWNYE